MVMVMESNGSTKFYLRLSFYTIIGMLVYVGLVLYLFNSNMMLRNDVNINISIILLIMIGFSIFQNIVIKNKNNNIKLAICLTLLVIFFGATAYSNNLIIKTYLSNEEVETYNGEQYIVTKINEEKYYYKIYSPFLKSKQANFSISKKVIDDNYEISTITYFDDKGQIKEVRTEGETKEVLNND
jgi:hypothetical protein